MSCLDKELRIHIISKQCEIHALWKYLEVSILLVAASIPGLNRSERQPQLVVSSHLLKPWSALILAIGCRPAASYPRTRSNILTACTVCNLVRVKKQDFFASRELDHQSSWELRRTKILRIHAINIQDFEMGQLYISSTSNKVSGLI